MGSGEACGGDGCVGGCLLSAWTWEFDGVVVLGEPQLLVVGGASVDHVLADLAVVVGLGEDVYKLAL